MGKQSRINDEASKKLSKLIKYYGFINPIIATPDGVIRAGHTRYKAAKLNKLKKVPVIFVDFKSEKKAVLSVIGLVYDTLSLIINLPLDKEKLLEFVGKAIDGVVSFLNAIKIFKHGSVNPTS